MSELFHFFSVLIPALTTPVRFVSVDSKPIFVMPVASNKAVGVISADSESVCVMMVDSKPDSKPDCAESLDTTESKGSKNKTV